jgi:hypothetical protein
LKTFIWMAMLALASASLGFSSDTLNTAGGVWAGPTAPTNGGAVFWDHTSWDGQFCNIGYFLNGTTQAATGCGSSQGSPTYNASGSPNLPFLSSTANGSGTAPDFNFTASSVNTATDVAGFRGDSETFGYYLESAPGTRIQLFASNAATSSINFDPTSAFGFYLTDGGNTYTTDANPGQFAVFDTKTTVAGSTAGGTSLTNFWIGVEDLRLPSGDMDYNDTIIHITSSGSSSSSLPSTPEPGYFGLVALGLAGIWFAARHRRRVQ